MLIAAVPVLNDSGSPLNCREGSLLLPTRSDQCTGHLALRGCITLTSTVIVWC